MAHKVEEKHHTERKFAPERARRVVHADEVVDAMQQSHEPDAHAKLVELTKHLLAGHDGPRKLVTQSYRDVTQQYLALQYALRQGERQQTPDNKLERLRTAIADLESDHGPSIRAGLNALPAAAEFARTAEGVGTFLTPTATSCWAPLAVADAGHQPGAVRRRQHRKGHPAADQRAGRGPGRRGAIDAAIAPECAGIRPVQAGGHDHRAGKLRRDRQRHEQPGLHGRGQGPLLTDIVAITDSRWVDANTIGAGRETRRGPVARPDRLFKSVRNIFRHFPCIPIPTKETRDAVLDANQAALDINIAKEDEA